jgi:hypothetical protein
MSDTMTTPTNLGRTICELGQTVQARGVKGLKTEAGATARITRFFANGDIQVLHVIVRRPDGLFTPVVFLKRDELYLASALAHCGVFVMAIA